jgi:hypothetical protein
MVRYVRIERLLLGGGMVQISGLLTGEKLEEGAQPSKGRFHIVREGKIDFTYSSKKV